MLRIYLLGQPRFMFGDQPLRLSAPPKTLPLWAYLLLHREYPLPRLSVAAALWPDETEAAARTNLRRHVHYLQRALPPATASAPWLLADSETIQWNPAANWWLDLAEFWRLSNDPSRLSEAADLYSGDLLENLYEDWLFYERERLRDAYFGLLGQLIRQTRARREYHLALDYAQRLLSRDPLREDVVRQVMTVHYEAGDRAGALQTFEQFVRRLRDELAVEPMPETSGLHDAIRRNAQLPGSARTSGVQDDTPVSDLTPRRLRAPLPFVGRESEMERLVGAWHRSAQPPGSLLMLLVGGEAGVGKTRLVTELANRVETQGGRVMLGNAPAAANVPYQAIREALSANLPLLAALEIEPIWLAAVATLVPELRQRRADLPRLSTLDPDRERTRLYDGLARALSALAKPRPVLLILEDMHVAGVATMALVEYLVRRLADAPMLLVLTYREDELPRSHPLRDLRRRLLAERLVEHLALNRLTVEAVETLLRASTGLTRELEPLASRLAAQSEGNPLLLELLLRSHLETGGPQTQPGRSSPVALAVPLPGDVEAAIEARFTRLSPAARSMAEVAAVIGPAFDVELVCQVSGWDEAEALDALGELLDRQLIREASYRSQFDYAFAHALIQATIYAAIPARRRKQRHRRIAQILEELHLGRLDELSDQLARHYDQGGAAARAIPHYISAARRALAVYADEEALAHLARGLALGAQGQQRFELLALREVIYHRQGRRADQQADLDELNQLAADLKDESLRFEVLRRQVWLKRALGERKAEADLIDALRQQAEAAARPRWLAEAWRAEAINLTLRSQYDQAAPILERALALCQSEGDTAGQVECYCALAEVFVHQGRFEALAPLLQRAETLAKAHGNASLVIQSLRVAANAAFAQQDFAQARRLAQQMIDLCQNIADRDGEGEASLRLAMIAARLSHVEEARRHFAHAEALFASLGRLQGQAAVLVNHAVLDIGRLGRYAEATLMLQKAQTLFQALGDIRGQTICLMNLGVTALFQGNGAVAKQHAQAALAMSRTMNSRALEAGLLANLGAAELELGELEPAVTHLQEGLALHRSLNMQVEIGADLTDLAIAYVRTGQLDAARQVSAEIEHLYDQAADQMVQPQHMLWAVAQTWWASGDRKQAHAWLARASGVMRDRLAAIPDEPSRTAAARLPFNREILAASDQGEWPRGLGSSGP